ncbi:hypothetical protein OGAPHI_002804 [Ogataea philodendri]|uniref:Cns1/TTC4 wheel domain-containing protein n=1 Tax=Ogataea philodendri TaxID=1378263 RepID=A0A9P8P8I0_9ASCO|nr:uncharacterized protein OGAPHI_002804 [Ogataea philodendri]KAH3667155.1 hypothetical protein OGAPHI_002804 [Ogataea philodendri]
MVEITELDAKTDQLVSEWEKRRYVPKQGEPDLPPQLSELAEKPTEEIMDDLNRLPLFMTELDETDGEGGENLQVEALKALAYEGEPNEIAENFKNQGNDCYKAKQYKNAVEYYTKGLDVDCGVDEINAALYLNRSACNLELKNYRRCINDAKECLKIQPKNVKALFRSAKAFLAIEKYDEADQILQYASSIDNSSPAFKVLVRQLEDRRRVLRELEEKRRLAEETKERRKSNLKQAVAVRNYISISRTDPSELPAGTAIRLEDPDDIETQLIIPTMVLYPTTDEFDLISEVSELSTSGDLIEIVLDRPESFFEDPKHTNFKQLEAFMETESGGLIKAGKKVTFNSILGSASPRVPLFDNMMRIFLVPKAESKTWISKWSKEAALKKRLV